MKIIIPFKKENWHNVYGSFLSSELISHQNGDINFNNEGIHFSNIKFKKSISYKDIRFVGERRNNLGLGNHLAVETCSGDIFYILIPNICFYIERILEFCPHIKSNKIRFHGKISYLFIKIILNIFLAAFVMLICSYQQPIFIIFPKVIFYYLIFFVFVSIYFNKRIILLFKKNKKMKKHNLLKIMFFIPIIGALIVTYYLSRYDIKDRF